jgi:hypothetical protein
VFRIATLLLPLLLAALNARVVSAQGPGSTSASASKAPTTATSAIRPGTYDLEVAFGGGVMQGTLELTTSGDSLTAKLHVGEHEPPVRSITRKGTHLLVDAGAEGMQLAYDFQFDGDAVSGSFTLNGDAGLVTGKRRK